MKKFKGLTLTELMITVVILGIIAGYGIPNFTTAIERGHRRDAENQLKAVYAANYIYRAQNSNLFWPTTGTNQFAATINATLSTNIIENGKIFQCRGVVAGTSFTCEACRNNCVTPDWTVRITEAILSGANPTCIDGTKSCPTFN